MTPGDFERVDELPARGEFGDDHCDGLKHFDLVVCITPQRLVLDDEHAENPVAAQNGHSHQRAKGLLPRLRSISEIRMRLGVGQGERPCGRRDRPNETFANAQPRAVNRFRAQPLGGKQFEDLARPHDIDRADFGHHLHGDDLNNPVEAVLGASRSCHDVAESAHEAANRAETSSRVGHAS